MGATIAAADTAVIQDNSGTPVTMWSAIGTGANFVDTDNAKRRWPTGFRVLTLAHGKLYILLE